MDESPCAAIQRAFVDAVRQIAAEDSALGDRREIARRRRIPHQGANPETSRGERRATGTAQKAGCAGD